jgi:hypothetical protein
MSGLYILADYLLAQGVINGPNMFIVNGVVK